MKTSLSRRGFAKWVAGGVLGAGLAGRTLISSQEETLAELPISIFSKHFQWLGYREMAQRAGEIGFDGIDLTVRPGGHVEPDRVKQDLPRAVREIESEGLKVLMMTTAVTDASDSTDRAVLETGADLGIRHYRLGYYRYTPEQDLDETLEQVRSRLAGLAQLNERLGIRGGYQNHAGEGYFGASLWDLWFALRDLPPDWIGSQFDLRHATVEGAESWPIDLRRIQPWIQTLVAKDFRWVIRPGEDARLINCPLGEGVVDFPRFLKMIQESGDRPPITLHLEFPLGGANHGARELEIRPESVIETMKRELRTLKAWLRAT